MLFARFPVEPGRKHCENVESISGQTKVVLSVLNISREEHKRNTITKSRHKSKDRSAMKVSILPRATVC